MSTFTVTTETITPAQAKKYLENNRCNRKINGDRVKDLAKKIRDGKYVMPPDAIAFDTTGRLINGQHRLTACVEAGIPILSIVYRNADEKVFMVTDIGMKKSGGQALSTVGYANGTNLAAIARIVYLYETTPAHLNWWNNGEQVDPTEVIDTVRQFPELQEHVTFAGTITKTTKANRINAPATGVGVSLHIATRAGFREEAEHLLKTTTEAIGLQSGDPELALLKVFSRDVLNRPGSNANMRAAHTSALILKALIAKMQGKKVTLLKWTPLEAFPSLEAIK